MKKTPLPNWRAGNPSQYGTFNPSQIFCVESGETVAQVYGVPLHQTLEEIDQVRYGQGLAHAKLVAAAPEMVKVLTVADELLATLDDVTVTGLRLLIDQALKAGGVR